MTKMLKKVGLSIALASAFGVSANAICLSENYCSDAYIGVGGFYENINGTESSIKNAGGFIAFGASGMYFNRMQLGADFKVGYGSNNLSGTNLASLNSNNESIYIDIVNKLGFNVATQHSPLFINLLFGGGDWLFSNNGVGKLLVYFGIGVEGRLALSEKLKLTYSAGYGYVIGGYLFGNRGIKSRTNGSNHVFMASLGTQIKVSEHIDFYLKAFGKYYDLNNSKEVQVNGNTISMPSTKTWHTGLEAGIAF